MKRIVTLFLSLVLLLSCLCAPASAMFDPSLFYEVQAKSAYIVIPSVAGWRLRLTRPTLRRPHPTISSQTSILARLLLCLFTSTLSGLTCNFVAPA